MLPFLLCRYEMIMSTLTLTLSDIDLYLILLQKGMVLSVIWCALMERTEMLNFRII